jgi:hypothetical protein
MVGSHIIFAFTGRGSTFAVTLVNQAHEIYYIDERGNHVVGFDLAGAITDALSSPHDPTDIRNRSRPGTGRIRRW